MVSFTFSLTGINEEEEKKKEKSKEKIKLKKKRKRYILIGYLGVEKEFIVQKDYKFFFI